MIAGYGIFFLGHLSPELTLKPTLERVYPALEVGHCCRDRVGAPHSAVTNVSTLFSIVSVHLKSPPPQTLTESHQTRAALSSLVTTIHNMMHPKRFPEGNVELWHKDSSALALPAPFSPHANLHHKVRRTSCRCCSLLCPALT